MVIYIGPFGQMRTFQKLKSLNRRDAEAQRKTFFAVNSACGAVNNNNLRASAVQAFDIVFEMSAKSQQ
jgi:hypothetical protein